jgi:hypothetical protein
MKFEDAIVNPKTTRKQMAEIYCELLLNPTGISWLAINERIISRWSFSGLVFIKNLAWNLKDSPKRSHAEGCKNRESFVFLWRMEIDEFLDKLKEQDHE